MINKEFLKKYEKILNKEEFKKFKKICETPLRKSIRVNTLKISIREFINIAKQKKWKLTPIPWCKTWFWIKRNDKTIPLWKSYLHVWGYFYIQEASSMIPAEILKVKTWEKILDLSAAPWSKTTQISALTKNSWLIVANEIEWKRLNIMKSNLNRIWALNCLITKKDWMVFSQYFPNFFDKILLDAPCTGEGTIRKDRSALNFWNQKWIQKFSFLQKRLLIEAFHALKKWWELVYSTCTLSKEENEDVISNLLKKFKKEIKLVPIREKWIFKRKNEFWLDWVLRVWPQDFNTEWFFIAKIKKLSETRSGFYSWIKAWKRKSPFVKIKKIAKTPIFLLLKNKNQKIKNIWKKWDEIWIRPDKVEEIASKIYTNMSWLMIWKINKKWEFDLTFEWGLALEKYLNLSFIELTQEEKNFYLKGYDLKNNTQKQSWFIFLRYKKNTIWIWKIVWKKIKNKLPIFL